MLISPHTWYVHLPGAVPDFGPYNEHFIRDLGCMFGTWGGLLLWAAFVEKYRYPIVVAITAWYTTHAFVHVYDTARGAVSSIHWVIDFPLCYAPALIFGVVLVLLHKQRQEQE